MITPARRGDERRPAVIFLQHRPMIGPCRWITQRILGIGDARRRGAHRRVVAIATDACPGALVLEANEHRAVVGILAQLVRKGFVDTALATVGVHRCPDRTPGLFELRQAVPVIADPLEGAGRGMMQTYLVLTLSLIHIS